MVIRVDVCVIEMNGYVLVCGFGGCDKLYGNVVEVWYFVYYNGVIGIDGC